MARAARGNVRTQKRRKVLKKTKGFFAGRKNIYKQAKQASVKAAARSFVGRKQRKRDARSLWQIKISAGAKANGISYSKLMGNLKTAKVILNRKMLAELAEFHPEVFAKVIELAGPTKSSAKAIKK